MVGVERPLRFEHGPTAHGLENQVSLVTMLERDGNILNNLESVLVEQTVAYSWMSAKAASAGTSAKNEAKFSKVFVDIQDTLG